MLDDHLFNKLINEQKLSKQFNLLLRKIKLLKKLFVLSIDQKNDYFNKTIFCSIERKNGLIERNNQQYIERQTLENLFNKIVFNQNLLIKILKRISIKLNIKKRITKNDLLTIKTKLNIKNNDILNIYWRSFSLNNLYQNSSTNNITKNSADSYLNNHKNKYSSLNYCSTYVHFYFRKLEKINWKALTKTIDQTNLN